MILTAVALSPPIFVRQQRIVIAVVVVVDRIVLIEALHCTHHDIKTDTKGLSINRLDLSNPFMRAFGMNKGSHDIVQVRGVLPHKYKT